jgi:hypothetical protein
MSQEADMMTAMKALVEFNKRVRHYADLYPSATMESIAKLVAVEAMIAHRSPWERAKANLAVLADLAREGAERFRSRNRVSNEEVMSRLEEK